MAYKHQEVHMKWQLVDLSLHLEPSLSEPEPVAIQTVSHKEGASLLTQGSGINPDNFPDGLGLSLERICLTSHSGTHVDAPSHYGPTCMNQRARAIDEMPLEWFFGPSVVLDCSQNKHTTVSLEEIKEALRVQKITLDPHDIVLINTGAAILWGTTEYFTAFRGMSVEATNWLLDQGIKVIGIDSFGFDAPFKTMIQEHLETGDQKVLWPCHMLGRDREYCQIERLANLDALPKDKKFLTSCFPIKLKGCGAGPSRVVALIIKEA